MKKIPSLFVRDYEKIIIDGKVVSASINTNGTFGTTFKNVVYKKGRFLATEKVTPGCEWVMNGEGIATKKWDGTAVRIEGGMIYKRYDAKAGKIPPPSFDPCQDPDQITGHWPGWVLCNLNDKADKWIFEAVNNTFPDHGGTFSENDNGTYEAIGPKINGNKEKWGRHELISHNTESRALLNPPDIDFHSLKEFLTFNEMEGIVFHHPDGRMCKVKRSDFGLPW